MPKPLHSEQYRTFIQALRSLREDASVSQTALAKRLGVEQTYVSKCETGVRRLDVVELRAWLRALGVGPSSFMATLDELLEAPERPRRSIGRG